MASSESIIAMIAITLLLQWNPSIPATLRTSESVLIRGMAGEFVFRSGLNTGMATFQGS